MASLNDLEQAIDTLLGHPLGIGQYQLVQRVEEKAYEAYPWRMRPAYQRETEMWWAIADADSSIT